MNKNSLYRKGFVIGIILLFVGTGFISGISGNYENSSDAIPFENTIPHIESIEQEPFVTTLTDASNYRTEYDANSGNRNHNGGCVLWNQSNVNTSINTIT